MFTGIFNPAFLQSACAKAEPAPPVHENVIKLLYTGTTGNKQRINLAGHGDIIIEYLKNGVLQTETVTDPHFPELFIQPDYDEFITIKGDVTDITCYGPPATYISSNVDVSECDTIDELTVGGPYFQVLKCRANSLNFVASLEESFADSVETTGVVFTNSEDTYYDRLAAAVTAKGWTIEEL